VADKISTLDLFFQQKGSSWQTPVRALPYWWLVARCPYPCPSSRQCKLQSSGAGCLHQLFWAKLFLDVQHVSSSQRVGIARGLWCSGDLLLGPYKLGGW